MTEIVHLELNRVVGKAAKDTLAGVVWGSAVYFDGEDTASTIFNEYVNPDKDAE